MTSPASSALARRLASRRSGKGFPLPARRAPWPAFRRVDLCIALVHFLIFRAAFRAAFSARAAVADNIAA